ncbi:MAG: hypothetical protein WAK60_09505 [Sedimentisphaerales bacterium]
MLYAITIPILANVIVATQISYFMVLMFCFIVIPIESAIFFFYQRANLRLWSSIWLIGSANIVSWLLGVLITPFIPIPEGFKWHSNTPTYFWGVVLGFVLSYFLSWFIEYQYLRLFRRVFTFVRLSWSIAATNLVSYAVIWIITFIPFSLRWLHKH